MRGKASAALDISDGLLADCGHMATASGVLLRIEQQKLPLSDALVRFAGRDQALQYGLTGGDDYVLAFTLPTEALQALQAEGWLLHVIGDVAVGAGVQLLNADGQAITLASQGYNHFSG